MSNHFTGAVDVEFSMIENSQIAVSSFQQNFQLTELFFFIFFDFLISNRHNFNIAMIFV